MTIEREVSDWGVRITVHPFKGTKNQAMVIRSEVGRYKPSRGCEVRIAFSATMLQSPLRLLDAQAWCEAMSAIIRETRSVVADMKAEATKGKSEKKR